MTTLTSRALSLVPIQLNMGPIGATDAILHPDGHILHVPSAGSRLQADALRFSMPKEERISPERRYSNENILKNSSICDMERRIPNGGHDEMSDARSSSVSSYVTESVHKGQDDDQMSYCSDESELSVGKEVEHEHTFDRRRMKETDENDTSDEQFGSPSREKVQIGGVEDTASDLLQYSSKVASNIIRPSPTRLQEEFLRKSQLYAEELLKHQMNFMAATRGLNISPKATDHSFGYLVSSETLSPIRSGDDHRSGFRPHVRLSSDLEKKWSAIEDRSSHSPEATSFRGIHSHLNAISKITSALGRDMINLTSPFGMTSRENSQSPPINVHHILNNNINDSNLKFSIDNILKPGFGASRRITDPLLKRSKGTRKNAQRLGETREKQGTPMDLTASPSTTPIALTSPTSSIASEQEKIPSPNASSKSTGAGGSSDGTTIDPKTGGPMVWPAWVYCTRYSDRPSSGPRTRRPKKPSGDKTVPADDKRPRTAFSGPQLARLKHEFAENRYLTERRRQQLSSELGLNEAQIKIWFQNKRAKIKKSSGTKNPLALQLMAQGLYNHSTVPLTREQEELQELQEKANAASGSE